MILSMGHFTFFCLSCVSIKYFPKFVLLKDALISHKINLYHSPDRVKKDSKRDLNKNK